MLSGVSAFLDATSFSMAAEFSRIAVATDGRNRGRIFVTYASAVAPAIPAKPTEQCVVSTQAFLVSSDDQGLHWSAPRPLGPIAVGPAHADAPPRRLVAARCRRGQPE